MSYRKKLVVFGLLLGAGLLGWDYWCNDPWVDAYVPNLFAATVEAGLIVLFVDWLREKHEYRRSLPVKAAASDAAWEVYAAARRLLGLIAPEATTGSVSKWDPQAVAAEAAEFDLAATPKFQVEGVNLDKFVISLEDVQQSADRCLSIYGAELSPELISALNDLAAHQIHGTARMLGRTFKRETLERTNDRVNLVPYLNAPDIMGLIETMNELDEARHVSDVDRWRSQTSLWRRIRYPKKAYFGTRKS